MKINKVDELNLKLPMPPTINHYYRSAPRGFKYLQETVKDFRETVASEIMVVGNPTFHKDKVFVYVTVFQSFAGKTIDLDNRIKGLWDALQQAGVFKDDSQINRFFVDRAPRVPKGKAPYVTVQIVSLNKRKDLAWPNQIVTL